MKFNIKTLCSVGALLLCSEHLFAMAEPYTIITYNKSWRSSEVSLSKLEEKSNKELSHIIGVRICGDKELSGEYLSAILKKMPNLQYLDLRSTHLTKFPSEICYFDVIGDISTLRRIEYGDNVMYSIYRFLEPVTLNILPTWDADPVLGAYRPKEGRMDLSGKNLSRVPLDILNLGGVKVLDLSNNNIKKIPLCFKNMSGLKEIILCGNPYFDSFDKIDDELLEVDLLKFVISAGNEQVGKTAKEIKKERIDQLTTELNAQQIRLDKLNSITPIKSLKTEGRYRLSN